MVFIRNLVGGLLAELEDDIDHDRFKRLLHYSRRLASFQNRAKLVRYSGGDWRRHAPNFIVTGRGSFGRTTRTRWAGPDFSHSRLS
jgi:hypothetical protein